MAGYKDQAMEIENTTFGTITMDGKTYEHDVVVRLSGEVVKRKKKLSKKYYGTSHILSKETQPHSITTPAAAQPSLALASKHRREPSQRRAR